MCIRDRSRDIFNLWWSWLEICSALAQFDSGDIDRALRFAGVTRISSRGEYARWFGGDLNTNLFWFLWGWYGFHCSTGVFWLHPGVPGIVLGPKGFGVVPWVYRCRCLVVARRINSRFH